MQKSLFPAKISQNLKLLTSSSPCDSQLHCSWGLAASSKVPAAKRAKRWDPATPRLKTTCGLVRPAIQPIHLVSINFDRERVGQQGKLGELKPSFVHRSSYSCFMSFLCLSATWSPSLLVCTVKDASQKAPTCFSIALAPAI